MSHDRGCAAHHEDNCEICRPLRVAGLPSVEAEVRRLADEAREAVKAVEKHVADAQTLRHRAAVAADAWAEFVMNGWSKDQREAMVRVLHRHGYGGKT